MSRSKEQEKSLVWTRENLQRGSLMVVHEATAAFIQDRPAFREIHLVDDGQIFQLLHTEVSELNGVAKRGYFSNPEFLTEYRQQELADILIFMQYIYRLISRKSGGTVLPDEENVLKLAKQYVNSQELLHGSENSQEFHFKKLNELLVEAAAVVSPDNWQAWLEKPVEAQAQDLDEMAAIIYALFGTLEKNPFQASMEKIARNHLLYPPDILSDDYSDILAANGLSQEQKLEFIKRRYDALVKVCKLIFDGRKIKGERGEYGTRFFYAPPEGNFQKAENPQEEHFAHTEWLRLNYKQNRDEFIAKVLGSLRGKFQREYAKLMEDKQWQEAGVAAPFAVVETT